LRDLTRYRVTLVQERARVVNRVQKLGDHQKTGENFVHNPPGEKVAGTLR
jgi:hypothetical protein